MKSLLKIMSKKTNINDINNLVDNVARSRYPNVNYEFYNEIANCIVNNIKLPQKNYNSNAKKMTREESIQLVREFYKSIDESFYLKIDKVLKDEDEKVKLNIEENRKLPSNYMPYVNTTKNGKQEINLIFGGTLDDAFDLAHELAHTLDIPNQNEQFSSRIECSEITSICIEKMFLNYLKENHLAIEEEILKQKNMQIYRLFSHSLEFAIKYSFFDIKNKTGKLDEKDVENIFRKYNLPYEKGINLLRNNGQDMHFNSKYIIAGITSEQFDKLYKEDKIESINNYIKYVELMKQNCKKESLDTLGVDTNQKGIENTIDLINRFENER